MTVTPPPTSESAVLGRMAISSHSFERGRELNWVKKARIVKGSHAQVMCLPLAETAHCLLSPPAPILHLREVALSLSHLSGPDAGIALARLCSALGPALV